MKIYKIGIYIGNKIEFVLEITAKNLQLAIKEWTILTGHNDKFFDEETNTYFGWKIGETKLIALERKATKKYFNY